MDHTSRKNGPEKRKGVEQNEILRQITEKLADIHSRGEVHGKTPSTHELDLEGKWDISNESLNEWRPAEETQSDDSLKPTQEGDIFSLGCYFYYVITGGQHPFGRSGQRALFIVNNLYHLAGCKDPHLQKLIAKMINYDCAKRPKSTELLKHPYLWTSKRTEEYLMEVAKNTDENGDQHEKWKGTILLSEKSVGLNGKKTTKVTNVAAVLREIKENKKSPSDLCKMFPNLLFSVFSEKTGSEIEDEIDESRPETSNELLIANGRYGKVESVVEIKRRHGRLGLQHVHVIQFPKDADDTTTKAERLRYLSHENCLQCFYLIIENSSEIFMAFEPFNETLETWLKKGDRKPLECDIINDILCQITKGLVFYHSNKFTHGNLSLSQIVIFEKGTGPDSAIVAKVALFSLNFAKYSPENQAAAMRNDIRELGQVFSYVLSASQSQESHEVSQSHVHLIRAMKELALPSAATVLKHPFLWTPETTTAFFLTADDYYTEHPNFDKISILEIAPMNPRQQNWKTNREALQAFSSQIDNLAAIERTSFVAEWKKQFPKMILQTWLRLQKFKNVSSDDDLDLISFYHPNFDFPEYDELICDEKNLAFVADDTPPPQNLEFEKSEIQAIYLDNFIKKEDKRNQVTSVIMKHIEKNFVRTLPLHVACQSDEFYERASALMDRGFDLNEKDLNGFAPLHYAVDKKALNIVILLIKKNAELEIRDNRYQITPIFFAANNNSASIVALFIKKNAKINNTDPSGRTPLHFAVKNNSLEAAKTLLEGGADVNAIDKKGYSSLHIATDINSIDMVKLLINYKGNPNFAFPLLQNADNSIGCVLHLAVVRNFFEMVEILLSAGADPNQKNDYGETALHLAALIQDTLSPNRLRIVNLLIDKGAKTDVLDNSNRTVLYAAVFNKAGEIVNRLLELDWSIEIFNQQESENGLTPLHLATMSNNYENIAAKLIDKGVRIDAKDNNGLTPLEYAAAYNAVDVAKRLLDCDAEAISRYQKKNIRSPLHVAAAYDALEVGELLIAKGADINSVDELCLTPLHYATFRKKTRFVMFLKSHQQQQSWLTRTAWVSADVPPWYLSNQQLIKKKTVNTSRQQRGLRQRKKRRHRLLAKQHKIHKTFLSKKLSPEELASIPQLVNCFEKIDLINNIPNNIQINHSFVTQFPTLLTFTQEILANISYGP